MLLFRILKNGHQVEVQFVKMYKGVRVTPSNKCNFDAITQILCSTYCDNELFKRTVEEKTENWNVSNDYDDG